MHDGQMGDNSALEVDPEQLEAFIQELADTQKSISETTGQFRSRIKSIIDECGWNNGAFGTIRKIANKSETARADFLRTFVPMLELMMERHWRKEMTDMLDALSPNEQADGNGDG